jgi:hypothetical protein
MFSKPNIVKAAVIGLFQIVCLVVLFVYCQNYIKQIIAENREKKEAELSPVKDDIGLTKIDWAQVKESKPEHVIGGVYLDRIQDFDIVHAKWSYEFYAWFKWDPKKINFINLKDSAKGAITIENAPVRIVNGSIEHIETHSFYLNSKGDSAYVLFHIVGSSTKFFDVSQYPLDNYLLAIQLESVSYDVHQFAFVPDTANSNVSSRVSVTGFEIGKNFILSKAHTIKSSLGDPRKIQSQRNTHSQLRFAVFIKRGGVGIYLKVFVTLYIAALLGFLSFFASENDKMRVIVGSLFFAAATLNIIMSRIPATGAISVAEIVNDISLVTVLLIAGRETLIKYLFRHNPGLNTLNKWITFIITFIFYVGINVAIPVICINALDRL